MESTDDILLIASESRYQVHLRSGFDFDVFSHVLSRGIASSSIQLSNKEFQCLVILDRAWPDGVGRDVFKMDIWKEQRFKSKCLDVYIFKLRKKLRLFDFEIDYRSHLYSLTALIPSPQTLDEGAAPVKKRGRPRLLK